MRKTLAALLGAVALVFAVPAVPATPEPASSDMIVVWQDDRVIRDCNIDGADRGIVILSSASNVVIDGCVIRNTKKSGIVIWGEANNVTITNTTIENPGLDGITAYDHQTRNVQLSNVVIRNAGNHGMHLGGQNISLVNVSSFDHTHAGVMVANHTNRPHVENLVLTNVITDGGRWGLWLRRIRDVDLGAMVLDEGRTLLQDCLTIHNRPC